MLAITLIRSFDRLNRKWKVDPVARPDRVDVSVCKTQMNLRNFFAIVALLPVLVSGQTPAELTTEYRASAREACQRVDKILKEQGAQIVAHRAAQGDNEGAKKVAFQIEEKLIGEIVSNPADELVPLFVKYDAARLNALAQIKSTTLQKIDRRLREAAKGEIKVALDLADLRSEVESGRIKSVVNKELGFPMKWDYFTSQDIGVRAGTLLLKEDGTLILDGRSYTEGKWKKGGRKGTLDVVLFPDGKEEKCQIIFNDDQTARFERATVGTRYLKSAP